MYVLKVIYVDWNVYKMAPFIYQQHIFQCIHTLLSSGFPQIYIGCWFLGQ